MKKHLSTIVLVFVFFVGLSVLLYPTVSDWWNARVQTRAVASYNDALDQLSEEDYTAYLEAARAYNDSLSGNAARFYSDEESHALYESLLDVDGTGMMGYIEIEAIGVSLPIYHGVGDSVLQVAVGHIEGSSLPVGGAGTHCVLSGHRGLPSARLFTDLDRLVLGDTFVLTVLGEKLTYEIDQILIVEPSDMSALDIAEGEDYCTLVTCTPYGINTHRMLVRGHRVDNAPEAHTVIVEADASQLDTLLVASVLGAAMLLVLLVWLLIATRRKDKKKNRKNHGEGRNAKK